MQPNRDRLSELTRRAEHVVDGDSLQRLTEGYGDVYHRRYQTEFESDATPESIIEAIGRSPNDYSPPALARFDKVRGQPDALAVGDRFDIRISGPWNGPVEVIDVSPTSWALATRRGHMEAGVIEFRCRRSENVTRFEIESWATSGGPVVWFTYVAVRIAKTMQTRMWRSFCQHVAKRFAVNHPNPVAVATATFPCEHQVLPQIAQRLRSLHDASYNFELDGDPADDPDWYLDQYEGIVGREAPGPPAAEDVFAAAKQLLVDYKFPDPRRLVGHFDRDAELLGRTMVLEAKFMGQRRYFGTRVSKVVDDQTTDDGQTITRFGWAYRTLAGHYEVGEMFFVLTKEHSTGEVCFAIKAYSQPGRIPNLLDRVVFWVVGRRLQKQFGARCVERMRRLVSEAMTDK